MKNIYRTLGVLGALALGGCASHSKDIAAAYVSPIEFENHSCEQLSEESRRVNRRATQLAGNIDETASNDSVQMGVGLVLFWPALFFLDGDGTQAQEYARLKGEMEAIEIAYSKKSCSSAEKESSKQEG
ncbi:hypothetical protein KIH87_13160 [Paraneptunicella aestuarii]|uniref:hypothetical protein n=1 Tax=Paraneptunicella aestuarii TaxID=2831148 RepID=UPI001E51066F|nr:hypothetical protein [Paraneptunicella aestuarii]UAA37654.1 hypothetical protein KIH87_13160 [Paraneptunicella aestuarii]